MFETLAGWIIWTALALGYVAMLVLTERSAAHFVASETRPAHATDIIVVTGAATPTLDARGPKRGLSPELSAQAR